MPITIRIPDDFFTEDERNKLGKLFNAPSNVQFERALTRVTRAALREYRDMFLGQGLPSRVNEIREHRLYYLIKEYFVDQIPSELQVSALFQLPERRSRSLILYVLTRFRYQLEVEIRNTLTSVIQAAQEINDGEEYRVVIDSENVVEELNRIIAQEGAIFPRLEKVRGQVNTYRILPDSFEALRGQLGLQ